MVLRSRFFLACAGVSVTLLLAALAMVVANEGRLAAPLALHVGERGADLFGGAGALYMLWGLGVAMVAVNAAVGVRLFRAARPLAHVFFGANAALAALLLIAVGTVVSLN